MRIRMVKRDLLLPRLSWHGIEWELLKNTPFFHVFIVLFYGQNMKVNSQTMTYNQSESRNVYAFKEKLIKETRFLCPKVVLANGVLLLDRGHISYGLFIHQLPIDVAILSCLPSPNHKKSNHVTVREKLKYLLWSLPNQQDYSKPDPETKECMKYIPAGGNFTDIPSEFRPMNSVPR